MQFVVKSKLNWVDYFFVRFVIASLVVCFFLHIGLNFSSLSFTQFDRSGDGLKNYYTFAYHLKYISDYTFTGLLYPFGDLTNYTDSQYPFVFLFQQLYSFNCPISPLIIINGIPILAFVFSVLLLLRIFEKFGVTGYNQVWFTILCLALSPQVLRIQSHFALSYPIFFLFSWYLVLKFKVNESWRLSIFYSFTLSVVLFISGLIHAYHLVVSGIFFGFFALIKYLMSPGRKSLWILMSVAFSFVCFLIIFYIIDNTDDRPLNPFGLWAYKTSIVHFLPSHGMLGELFNNNTVSEGIVEGYCYTSLLPILIVIFYFLKKISRSKIFNGLSLNLKREEMMFVLASILTLLIAMGAHLYIFNDWLFNLFPQVKQFRALGRFSWPFYYVLFVMTAVLCDRWLKTISQEMTRRSITVLILIVLAVDAFSFHKDFGKLIDKYKTEDLLTNELSIATVLGDTIASTKFQAMLPIPASTEGAEKFNLKTNYFLKTRCLPFSFQTGMPLSYAIMSRVSMSKMFKLLQLSNSIYGQRTILNSDFPSTKPLLIVIPNDYKSDYNDLLGRSKYIGNDNHISLYSIELDSLLNQQKYDLKSSKEIFVKSKVLSNQDSFLYFNDFSQSNNELGIANEIGHYFLLEKSGKMVQFDLKDQREYSRIELSFWNKILIDKSDVPLFEVKFLNFQGEEIAKDEFRDWNLRRTEVYDDWVRYYREYDLSKDVKSIEVIVNGQYQHIDNLLIKTPNVNFIKHLAEGQAYMNHLMVKI